MTDFIVRMILSRYDNSLESARELYSKYFINTKLYANYRQKVDEMLTQRGLEEIIVK